MEPQNRGNQGQPGQGQDRNGGGSRRRRRRGSGGGNRPSQSAEGQPGEAGTGTPQSPRQASGQNSRPGGGQGRHGNHSQQRSLGSQNGRNSAENRNRSYQSGSRGRSRPGRVLTINQVLVKYENLLEQHLITRRKYYDYFNRVDDRQLRKLEKNFFDSIEHLRRFEANLEPWQREALEKRKTERYRPDLTYSSNRGWDPEEIAKAGFEPDENEDPHFKDSQKEAFEEYKEDTEESSGSYEDYLKYKGQS